MPWTMWTLFAAGVALLAVALGMSVAAVNIERSSEQQMAVEHHMNRVFRDTVDWDVDDTTLTLRNGEHSLHLRVASAHD